MSSDVLTFPDRAPSAGPTGAGTVPIGLRVPNPPPHWVGRRRELQLASDRLAETPLLLITGPAGIGKTAFACALVGNLRQSSPSPRDNWVFAALQARAPGRLIPDLLDQLGRLGGLPPEWKALASDRALALATLVDLADHAPWHVVIDGADAANQDELDELLLAVAAYSRRSRWLVTIRELPERISDRVATIELPGLSPSERAELARRIQPEAPDELGELPSNPAQLLLSRRASDPRVAARDTARWHLAHLRRPLPIRVLESLPGFPDRETLTRLLRTGELIELPRGLWLRRDPGAVEPRPPGHDAAAVAHALIAFDNPDAVLEAIRLYTLAGATDTLVAVLRTWAESLCEAGYSADLWQVLADGADAAPGTDPEVIAWRLWAAFEWGDPSARADLDAAARDVEPAPSYPAQHLRARIAIGSGDFALGYQHAMRAADLAADANQRDRALCRAARCRYSQGRYVDVLAIIDECTCQTDDVRVECAIAAGEALVGLGRPDEAAAAIDPLLGTIDKLSPAARFRLLLGAARIRLVTQRLIDAERLIELLLTTRADHHADGVSARTALEFAASVAVQRGRLRLLGDIGQRLLLLERVYPVRLLFVRSYLASAQLWNATADEVERSLDALRSDVVLHTSPIARDIEAYLPAIGAQLALVRGTAPDLSDAATSHLSPWLVRATDSYRSLHRARWGLPSIIVLDEAPQSAEHSLQQGLVRATLCLYAARLSDAAAEFRALGLIARDSGLALYGLLAAQGLCIAHASAGQVEDLAAAARIYAGLAGDEAPRATAEAEFFAACAQPDGPSTARLLAWAADPGVATTRARWARHLLGDAVAIDPCEAGLLRAGLQRTGRSTARFLGHENPGIEPVGVGTLVIDPVDRSVVSASGLHAVLSQHETLWRILQVLAQRGEASKEDLVLGVWDVREYHPLHHDNRLRVGIRKLRTMLEAPAHPSPIVTVDGGYALAGDWRIRDVHHGEHGAIGLATRPALG